MDSARELDGWLQKLAKSRREGAAPLWQRRWFALRGDLLCFYNTEQDAISGGAPKWSLDLSVHGATAKPFLDPMQAPDATRLELSSGDEIISLRADSEAEAEMWAAALATAPQNGSGHLASQQPQPTAAMGAAPPVAPGVSMFDGLGMMSAAPAPVSAFDFLSAPAPAQPTESSALAGAAALPADGAKPKKKIVRKAKLPGMGDPSEVPPSAGAAGGSTACSTTVPMDGAGDSSISDGNGGALPAGMFDGLSFDAAAPAAPPTAPPTAPPPAPPPTAPPPAAPPPPAPEPPPTASAFSFLDMGTSCATAPTSLPAAAPAPGALSDLLGMSAVGGGELGGGMPSGHGQASALPSVQLGSCGALGGPLTDSLGASLGGVGSAGGGALGGACALSDLMMGGASGGGGVALSRASCGGGMLSPASADSPLADADSAAAKAAEKEKRRREREEKKAAKAAAAAAAANVEVAPSLPPAPPPAPPPVADEDIDLGAKATDLAAAVGAVQAQRRQLFIAQAEAIRKRAGLASEISRLAAAADNAVTAQGEAAAKEDYELAVRSSAQALERRPCPFRPSRASVVSRLSLYPPLWPPE